MIFALQRFDKPEVGVLQEAADKKNLALAMASSVVMVDDERSEKTCREAILAVRKIITDTERDRQAIKSPVLMLERQIDDFARSFGAPCVSEITRLEGLIRAYDAKLRAALAKIEAEAREAERQRQAQIAEEQRRIEAARAKAKTESEQRILDLRSKIQQAVATQVPVKALEMEVVPARAAGVRVPEEPTFAVEDLKKLAAHDWNLVRVDVNRVEVNKLLATGIREIPGLRIWMESKVRVR